MHGRCLIQTDYEVITKENLLEVLKLAYQTHLHNRADIKYLYDYYCGLQPILGREKQVRPEINNKLVENRANEIVSFKVGYLMGEPIQYVSRGEGNSEAINKLNEYVFAEDKAAKDKELADWFHICGTSYRMVLPDKAGEEDEAPFEIHTLDPRSAFVVYHNGLGDKPVMGVTYVTREKDGLLFSVYTPTTYFECTETEILEEQPHTLNGIPIVEYPLNQARIGAFELVLPLLDAINNADSNRLDGVEQFVQSLMLFHNVDISTEDYKALKEEGAIKYRDIDPNLKAEVKYLISELNQTQTQTLVDHLYQTVLTICGMPNRNGGSSTSDTGSAVIMRDGWSAAEARAKDTELMFKKSEKQFLKIMLHICRTMSNVELKLSDIEIRFTRRNYENIQEKAQVLTTMLDNGKIHPQLAFAHCGLFVDSEMAYTMSKEYAEQQAEKAKQIQEGNQNDAGTDPGADSGDRENPQEGESGGAQSGARPPGTD